jgi:hypothetical protein
MAGAEPRTSGRSLFKQFGSTCSMSIHALIINNEEYYGINSLIQGINFIFADQMIIYLVKKVHFMLASKYSPDYHVI